MASGILSTTNLSANVVADVYTVPASTLASVNINVCNRNATAVKIRLALSATSVTQAAGEFIEFDVSIVANGVLERTGVMLNAGKIITAYSDTNNVSVVVTGVEETV